MPTNVFLLAIAAGIISAVVFASATTGAMLLRVVLFLLTPLSLYLAGLGLGVIAGAIAAITATTAVMLMTNPLTAEIYAISTAIPAFICTRFTLMSRGPEDDREWYPIGRIVVIAALFAGVFAMLALVLMGGDIETLTKMLRGAVEAFVKSELSQIPGAPAIGETEIDQITRSTLSTLPWALGLLAMATILLNLWLAGRITLASGRLVRPWPDLAQFKMPAGATLVLLIAIALTFTGGMTGLLAAGVAAPFTLAFALVGLGLVHVLTRGSPWRSFILSALYIGAVLVPHIGLLLALVGLAETIFSYRTAGKPPQPPT
jgi:magnesium-transporting ATPase (P-type)